MNTKQKLTELLEQLDEDGALEGELFYGEESCVEEETEDKIRKAGFELALMDRYGGEGEGEQYWAVWRFSANGEEFYVKLDGWYASYQGSEYTEWFFVTPEERKVIFYSKEKE